MTPLTRRGSGLCAEAASGHAQKKLNGVPFYFLSNPHPVHGLIWVPGTQAALPSHELKLGTAHAPESEIDSLRNINT